MFENDTGSVLLRCVFRDASFLLAKIIGIIGRQKQRAKNWHDRSKFEQNMHK